MIIFSICLERDIESDKTSSLCKVFVGRKMGIWNINIIISISTLTERNLFKKKKYLENKTEKKMENKRYVLLSVLNFYLLTLYYINRQDRKFSQQLFQDSVTQIHIMMLGKCPGFKKLN